MPLLLCSEKIIEGDSEDLKDLPRFMVRHQKPVLLPSTDGLYSNIMAAAVTSLSTGPVHKYVGGLPMKIAEISTFALHYAAVVYITTLLKKSSPTDLFSPYLPFTWRPLHRDGVHRWTAVSLSFSQVSPSLDSNVRLLLDNFDSATNKVVHSRNIRIFIFN